MEISTIYFMKIVTFLLLVDFRGPRQADAFTCYKCSSNENELCAERPSELSVNSAIVECERYCTIVRTEYTDIPGEIVTLVRDCANEEPLVLNDVRTDKHYTKMYTSCDTNICNDGDGKLEPGMVGGSSGPKNRYIVPESNDSFINKPRIIIILGALLLCYRLGFHHGQ